MRNSISEKKHNIGVVYADIIASVRKSGGIPIGISNDSIDDYFNLCRGFIFQGGDDVDENNLIILKKLRDKNIPVLGICLGMQEIGTLYEGILTSVSGHNDTKHMVHIIKDSFIVQR